MSQTSVSDEPATPPAPPRRRRPRTPAPVARSTRMPVAERRQALLDAATTVIARDGVRAASTRAIVREAGMSLASFHYAFESHTELMRHVIERVLVDEVHSVGEVLSTAGQLTTGPVTLEGLLEAALDAFVAAVEADPAREQAILELHQYALREPELADLVRAEYDAYDKAAAEVLVAAAAATGTRWTRPVDVLARYVVTLLDGLTTSWLSFRDPERIAAARELAVSGVLGFSEPDPDA
ncbi:TetR/AcrR family transcriptional regulator [Luteimicrobium sp. DT211]|uniref:TetR/AcrR family transcriptional regulator n=1 Tax=Luteimicrobium sp. DT211 TaxID=3393412 RepID=UPI003CEDAD2C